MLPARLDARPRRALRGSPISPAVDTDKKHAGHGRRRNRDRDPAPSPEPRHLRIIPLLEPALDETLTKLR
jgi:hypothetical protein